MDGTIDYYVKQNKLDSERRQIPDSFVSCVGDR